MWVVSRTIVVANQDRDSWWRKANLTLNYGNTRRIDFRALEDQIETSPTQISNLCHQNGNGSRNPSAERRTHEHQHHAQAHATRWVDGFKLDTLEFHSCLQPKEFMVVGKNRKFSQKEIPKKMAEMVPKEGAEIKHQLVSRYIGGICRPFLT
jgi:hypothetical protein